MEGEGSSYSEASSYQNLAELAHYVDLEFVLSNTSSEETESISSQDEQPDSLCVMPPSPLSSLQSSVDSEEVEGFAGHPYTEYSEVLGMVTFIEPPVPIPAPTPSLTVYQQLAPPPSLPGTSNAFYPPYQYQLQNNDMNMLVYPQQQMFNMPPPMQPQQYHLHPEQMMPATQIASYPKKMEAPNVESVKTMKENYLQDPEACMLVGPQFFCSFPGCHQVYLEHSHYISHLRIHSEENQCGCGWGSCDQQFPGPHQHYLGQF